MTEKLRKYLKGKSLESLATIRSLASSICNDYDKNLTTYATLNDDKLFQHMPEEVEKMHERRKNMFSLLMCINEIIEDKLFNIYNYGL